MIRAERLGGRLSRDFLRYHRVQNKTQPQNVTYGGGSGNTHEPSPSDPGLQLQQQFFGDAIKGVQHLELFDACDMVFFGTENTFGNLTTLRLVRPSNGLRAFPLGELLRTLRASKRTLEDLTLVGFTLTGGGEDKEPVDLPALRSLELGHWSQPEFFAHIRLPALARICFWGNITADLLKALPIPSATPIARLVLSSLPGGDMVTIDENSVYANDIPFTLLLTLLQMEVSQHPSIMVKNDITELVFTPLSTPLTIAQWKALFELLPGLETVRIRNAEAGAILLALQSSQLPALETIDLTYSETISNTDPLGREFTSERTSLAALLVSLARSRSRSTPLARVCLRMGGRASASTWRDVEEAVEVLKGCVGRVVYGNNKSSGVRVLHSVKERKEREREKGDVWWVVKREVKGWPTRAVWFMRELGE